MDDEKSQGELLKEAKEYLNNNKRIIGKKLRQGDKAIMLDFNDLASYSINIAEELITNPERSIQLLEVAARETEWLPDKINIRFMSMSSSQHLEIRNIRSKHLGKMISIDGVIRRASEVRPQVINIKFECPTCGSIISILQTEREQIHPTRCSCGRKSGFKEVSKDLIDSQVIIIEETPDSLEDGGDQPKRLKIFLKEDLTDKNFSKKINPGSKVKVIGVLKEIAQGSNIKKPLVTYDIAVEANNVIMLNEDSSDMEITDEDEVEILQISKRKDLFEYLSRSVAPSIYGNKDIKNALMLQLFSGVSRRRSDGSISREQIHGLLVGDPGVAKSVILKYLQEISNKSRYVSGKSASGVGLTATATKDELTKEWALEAGAMVLANNGSLFIDEFEKMSEEDRSNLHEGMSIGTISVSKANIQACYSEDTEVLTENGWMKYCDVGDTKIAQYSPIGGTIDFIKHNGLYVYDYSGKMYHFKNKRNNILVTPNHTMLTSNYHKNLYKKINAEDIKFPRFKFNNSGDYIGINNINNIEISNVAFKQNRTIGKYTNKIIKNNIPIDVWIEFLGYYLSRGSININNFKKSNKKFNVSITQNKGDNAYRIEKCLEKLVEILACKLTKTDCGKYYRFQITNKQLHEHLYTHGIYNHNKTLNMNISRLNKKNLRILFDALMLGGGCSTRKCYRTTSKKLANEFQSIAMLIGKSASIGTSYTSDSNIGRKTLYRITLSDRIHPMVRQKDIGVCDYNGKVWCFSTQTGFFITRRGGKVAIQGNTLNSRTSILAAANPKFGRFESDKPFASQINLAPSLLSRFDFIFVMRDVPEEERDTLIANKIFEEHSETNDKLDVLGKDMFKKYVAYAKRMRPKMGEGAIKVLKDYYIGLRKRTKVVDGRKIIPIGARQLEGLIRFSEASAKARLSRIVAISDANRAINIMETYLLEVGYDKENNTFDIDKMTGNSASQRNKIDTVKNIIKTISKDNGNQVQIEKIKDILENRIGGDDIDETIEKLTRNGDCFRPKRGYIQLM